MLILFVWGCGRGSSSDSGIKSSAVAVTEDGDPSSVDSNQRNDSETPENSITATLPTSAKPDIERTVFLAGKTLKNGTYALVKGRIKDQNSRKIAVVGSYRLDIKVIQAGLPGSSSEFYNITTASQSEIQDITGGAAGLLFSLGCQDGQERVLQYEIDFKGAESGAVAGGAVMGLIKGIVETGAPCATLLSNFAAQTIQISDKTFDLQLVDHLGQTWIFTYQRI